MKVFFLFTLIIGIAFFGRSQSFEFWNSVGAKYKIIDTTDLPDDTFRDAWEFDFTTNFDGISEGNGL